MKKIFGEIIVQKSGKWGCGIVELITQGCVVCFWEVRNVDGEPFPEIRVVHDRMTSMGFNPDDFWDAANWGQRYAEKIVKKQ